MDDASGITQWGANQWGLGAFANLSAEGLMFPGYAFLAELAQRPEYRKITDTVATEMTRKWIKFNAVGDKDKTDKIKELVDFMDNLRVRDHYAHVASVDGFFGRGHIFHDFGTGIEITDSTELATSVGNGRDLTSQSKIKKGSLKRLQVIEPTWVQAQRYNTTNPLASDWYRPEIWYVMGRGVHRTRLHTFVGRPVPDMLKPSYAFGGLSLSQVAKPYVDIWLTTRQSVGELIHAFSVMVLKTNLSTLLQPGGAQALLTRAALFNATRDNQGLMMIDEQTEDFMNVSASIAGLADLQAQSQEHVASVVGIPLVKYTGIQPKGLNASSDGEIRVWYDLVLAMQNFFFRPNLTETIDFAMISLWGKVDDDITYEFVPLWEMSEKEKAEMRKLDAETDQLRIDSSVVSPEEVRTKLAADPESPYHGLDHNDLPDLMEEEEEGIVDPRLAKHGGKGSEGESGGGESPLAGDADFNESDHPRANNGQFGSGGGGSTGGGEKKAGGEAKPYGAGIKAFGIQHAEAQKKEWRESAPKTIEALVKDSPANQAAMAEVCDALAKEMGLKFKNPGVKSEKRLVEKIEAGRKPENITDAVRGGFDVNIPEEGDRIVHMLAQKFEVADEGWQKNAAGYFDRKTMVRFPDGQVGEIQMWPPGMLEAKESGGGHKLYEKWRTLDRDSTEAAAINDQMIALYAKVEAALPGDWGSLFRKAAV